MRREKLLLMVTVLYAFLLSLLPEELEALREACLRWGCHRTGKRAQPPLGSLSCLARCTFLTFGMTHLHRLRQCLIQYIQHTASIATAIAMVAMDTSVLPLSIARTASISAATAASPLTTKNTISDVLTLFMPA